MRTRTYLLAAVAGLATVLAVPAGAQSWGWQEHEQRDRDRDHNNANSAAYQDGYRDGIGDREHRRGAHPRGHRWKSGSDRHAYEAGYRAGFHAYGGDRDDRRGPYGNDRDDYRGPYDRDDHRGPYGAGARRSPASEMGYQDGLNDGRRDRSTGHSFRPTQGDNYKHADRGYNSSFGSKDQFKQEYRQAYSAAYQRGYYQR